MPTAVTMNGTCCAIRPADEGDVAAEPVELGDSDFALSLLSGFQRRLQLRTAIERVGTFAGLDLGEFGDDGEARRRTT